MSMGTIARPHPVAAVSTPTGTKAGFPVGNVLTQQPRQKTVFTASPATIDIDLGSALDVRFAAVVAAAADSWELRHAATQADLDSAPALAVPDGGALLSGPGVSGLFWDGFNRTDRWWRVTLTGTPDMGLGRIVLSDSFEPAFTFAFGRVAARAPGFELQQAAGGAVFPNRRPQRRRWSITFDDISDAEYRGTLDALDAYTAGGGEVVLSEDPGSADAAARSLYGLLRLAQGATRRSQNRWRAPITLEELT